MSERVNEAWIVFRRAIREAREDGIAMTAQALAYSLFLAIPAIFLVLLGLFSLFAGENAVAELVARARAVMPQEATVLLEGSLHRATQDTRAGVFMTVGGFLLGLWTTTSAATTLMSGLTSSFGRRDSRGFLRKRLVALAIVVALALGSALVLALLVLGPHLERWVASASGEPTVVEWTWWTAQWPILAVGLLFAFAIVLYLGPDVDQRRWQLVTPGAVAALVIWLVGSSAFALYASDFGSYDKTWGTLSAVIVTLVWLWLTSAALLFGAEVNSEAQQLEAQQLEAERADRRGVDAPIPPTRFPGTRRHARESLPGAGGARRVTRPS